MENIFLNKKFNNVKHEAEFLISKGGSRNEESDRSVCG